MAEGTMALAALHPVLVALVEVLVEMLVNSLDQVLVVAVTRQKNY